MSEPERQQLLRDAVEDILEPLARLCVAHGLPFAQAEELFKRAYVRAARDARRQSGASAVRDISQVSMATGLNRREVTRLTAELRPRAAQRTTPANEVFLRWVSDRRLRGADGQPRALPRTGRAPSFEALALRVTRQVHPRSLLDELCRLGLARLDEATQRVSLVTDRFVPQQDERRMIEFLGSNVGDHLAGATANVVHGDRRHVEQAVFTDELSEDSAAALTQLVRAHWQQLLADLIPQIEDLIQRDQADGRTPTRRARVGLFSYHDALQETPDEPTAPPSA